MASSLGVLTSTIASRRLVNTGAPPSPRLMKLSNSPQSQFWGSKRLDVPSVAVKDEEIRKQRALVVRNASFVDKLVQLFVGNPADEEQVMGVYEFNFQDRGSPQYLSLCPDRKSKDNCLGDLVPYSNKVYGPSGTEYLGISAGLCTVIEHHPEGDRFETTYTHYIAGHGQLSGMGPYYSYADSEMVVTGGTGVFKGARGVVKIKNLYGPLQLLYTYYLTGIPKLPAELTSQILPPPKYTVPIPPPFVRPFP